MKKYMLIAALLCIAAPINGAVNFGSPQSAIKISSGGTFHLGQSLTNVDGTINRKTSGAVTGDTIEFTQGTLQSNQTEIGLTGSYDGDVPSILLNGNDLLRAEPGTIVEAITIAGANNTISGQPLFSSPIVWQDAAATLIMAIHSKLNQNLDLNGGTLQLDHDLELSDGVNIVSGGTIKLNNNEFAFGSAELDHTVDILWDHANAEYLHGKTNLGAVWTYDGESMLNGNGNVLDLSLGGTIFVNPNTTLFISDIIIKGLGDGYISFANDTSKIILSNVDIELATSYTTTRGNIYVEGPSTFILEDKDWYFDETGSLSVDGVVLWTDRKGTPTTDRGFVLFGSPESQHYASINSGTIKEKVYLSDVETLEGFVNQNAADIAILQVQVENNSNAIVNTWELTVENSNAIVGITEERDEFPWDGIITSSIAYCESGHIDPCEQMIIAGDDVTLNGSGSMIVFSSGDDPQFIVQPGKTVTLEELNFQNVNSKTFQLGKCSRVKIGRNVTFGITEDIILDADKFELVDGPFTIYGIGGIRRLGFNDISTCERCSDQGRGSRRTTANRTVFNLNGNTLNIKNIELLNVEEIGNNEAGRIKMQGSSIINFNEDCDRHFIIEGIDNLFRMRKNNIAFGGSVSFGEQAHNTLHMIHKIPGGMTVQPNVFFGDMFMYIASTNGVAQLVFDDDLVRVTNRGYNAFVVGDNSFLGGRQLEIWDYPIRQISDQFDTADDLVITSNLDSPIEPATGFYVPPTNPHTAPPPPNNATIPGLIGYQVGNNGPRPLILRSPQKSSPVVISGKTVENFEFPDMLFIENGTRLTLAADDVELKPDNVMYVSGKNNVILVTKSIALNGTIFFEEGSELTLEFENIDPKEALRLPEGVQINPDAPIEIRVIGDEASGVVRR